MEVGSLYGKGYQHVYKTFPLLLSEKYHCSSKIAEKLVKVCQKKLSFSSIEYVQQIAAEIGSKTLQDRLSNPYIVLNARKARCGPCYYEFYALTLEAKRRSYSFVMKIYETPEKSYQLYLKDMNKPKLIEEENSLQGVPHIVMEGRTLSTREVVLAKFREHGVDKILMAFAAQHEQYPKKVKGIPIPEEDDLGYRENAAFAEENGYSYNNPSVFITKHIHN